MWQESEDEAQDYAPPSSQPRPVSDDEQDKDGAVADVQPEGKTTRRKRKRDLKKEEKRLVEDGVAPQPQLQGSQTWYEGDDAGKTVLEVAVSEPKAKKVKKELGVEELKKKEEYAGQKASKRAKKEKSEDTTPQNPTDEAAATNKDHDEVSVIGSGGKTKSQRRRDKRVRVKATKQGETTSAPSVTVVRTHEQKMASDEAKRAARKNKTVPATTIVPATTTVAAAAEEVPVAKKPSKEATSQRFTKNSSLPKELQDSIAKSRAAVEAAKANVPVRTGIVVEEKGWVKEKKRIANQQKEKNAKKAVTAEETEELKKEKSGRRKRKRNQNALPESETGQEGKESAVKDGAEGVIKTNKAKDVIAVPGLEDGEKPKKKARKSRKPKTKTPADEVVPQAEVMDGVEQTTASDQVKNEAPSGNKSRSEVVPESEVMNGVEQTSTSDQVNTEAPSDKKRRSRGKKAKKETEAKPEPTEAVIDEPLTELPNTNTKKVKAGRRDRVKNEKSSTDTMEVDTEIANGNSKGYHS